MNRKILLQALVLFIALSCQKKSIEKGKNDTIRTQQLISKPIEKIKVLTSGNVALNVIDSLLIIQKREEYVLEIYSTNSYSKLLNLGRIGRGPGEFKYPEMLNQISNDTIENSSLINVYDIERRRFSRINLKKAIKDSHFKINQEQLPDLDYYLLYFHYMDKELMIATPEAGSRFMIYDFNSNRESIIPYPSYLKFDLLEDQLSYVYKSSIAVNKSKNLIVAAPYLLGRLDFYNLKGEFLFSSVYDKEINLEQELQQKTPNLKLFISKIKTRNNFIFALNNNMTSDEGNNWNGKIHQEILVFNWEGELIQKLELDQRKIESFAVDTHNKKIYAFSRDEEQYNIIEYSYNSLK